MQDGHSRGHRLALAADAQRRARRILTRVHFHSPEQIRAKEATGEAPGLYARVCLNVGYLITLAQPLPAGLRQKMECWDRAVREQRKEFFLALAPFSERRVSKADAEECLRKLRGGAA